jgi:hypothetical protein
MRRPNTREKLIRSFMSIIFSRTFAAAGAIMMGAPTSAKTIADAVTSLLAAEQENLRERVARRRDHQHRSVRRDELAWLCDRNRRGLRGRGANLAVQTIVPLRTEDYRPRPSGRAILVLI